MLLGSHASVYVPIVCVCSYSVIQLYYPVIWISCGFNISFSWDILHQNPVHQFSAVFIVTIWYQLMDCSCACLIAMRILVVLDQELSSTPIVTTRSTRYSWYRQVTCMAAEGFTIAEVPWTSTWHCNMGIGFFIGWVPRTAAGVATQRVAEEAAKVAAQASCPGLTLVRVYWLAMCICPRFSKRNFHHPEIQVIKSFPWKPGIWFRS
jgi:hypothetical protein